VAKDDYQGMACAAGGGATGIRLNVTALSSVAVTLKVNQGAWL
jgi:hypothetical protein